MAIETANFALAGDTAPETFDESLLLPLPLETAVPSVPFGDQTNRYVRGDVISGFTSADPAVRDEQGRVEYYDC